VKSRDYRSKNTALNVEICYVYQHK